MSEEKQKTMNLLPEVTPKLIDVRVQVANLPKTLPGPAPSTDMIESVKALGVIEPVILSVKQPPQIEGVKVEDGRRRILAARAAGLDRIPARLISRDAVRRGVLTLVLNEQRTANPVAEAEAIRDLFKAGASERDVARDCKLSVGTVRARMRLLNYLDPKLLEKLRKGKISIGVAHKASRLPKKSQTKLVKTFVDNGKLTAKDVDDIQRVRKDAVIKGLSLPTPPMNAVAWAQRLFGWLDLAEKDRPDGLTMGTEFSTLKMALKRYLKTQVKEAA